MGHVVILWSELCVCLCLFLNTSMGHYTWYFDPCNELSLMGCHSPMNFLVSTLHSYVVLRFPASDSVSTYLGLVLAALPLIHPVWMLMLLRCPVAR
jgi:hypothetical protein